MKKLYTLLMVAFLAVMSVSAQTYRLSIDLDNADAVTVTNNGTEVECVTGMNSYDVNKYAALVITPKDGYVLDSVVNKAGTAQSISSYGGMCYLYAYPANDGEVFTVKTIDLATAEKAHFTIECKGDPTMATASLSGTNKVIDLTTDVQTVEYVVGVNKILNIGVTNYAKPLYNVTVNGVDKGAEYSYEIVLEPDMVVVIDPSFPEKPCTYTFNYVNGDRCVNDVFIDNELLEDFDGNTFTCNAGDIVKMSLNTTEFAIDKLMIGDVEQEFSTWQPFTFTASNDAVISITAHKYAELHFTVNVNHADGLTLYKGYNSYDGTYDIVDGANELTVLENANYFTYSVDDTKYYLVSVLDNKGNSFKDGTTIYVEEDGMEYTFVLAEYQLDQTSVIWVDNKAATSYMLFNNVNRSQYALETGYNTLKYDAAMNPFQLMWNSYRYNDDDPMIYKLCYLNGELVDPVYENTSSFELQLNNGDVVKCFIAGEPVESHVSFTADEGVAAEIMHDLIVPVTDPGAGLTCFDGTQIDITPLDEKLTKVLVNGAPVEAVDNKYTVTVKGDTEIELKGNSLGIEDVIAEGAENGDVYNLQGVKVGTAAQLRTLPAGLYISGGKKVVVK